MNALARIVRDYRRDHRDAAAKELRWFASRRRTFRQAVELAALAKSPSGKRLSHQRRIRERVLDESCRRLVAELPALEAAHSFGELHGVITATIRPIVGIGELTVYDTTLRIGAFLRLEPCGLFLHAGTRVGARKLGLDTSHEFLPLNSLPAELRVLKPHEIEDVLCIYKHRLGVTAEQRGDPAGRPISSRRPAGC